MEVIADPVPDTEAIADPEPPKKKPRHTYYLRAAIRSGHIPKARGAYPIFVSVALGFP